MDFCIKVPGHIDLKDEAEVFFIPKKVLRSKMEIWWGLFIAPKNMFSLYSLFTRNKTWFHFHPVTLQMDFMPIFTLIWKCDVIIIYDKSMWAGMTTLEVFNILEFLSNIWNASGLLCWRMNIVWLDALKQESCVRAFLKLQPLGNIGLIRMFVKWICPTCKMYLSKLWTVFVQIWNYICPICNKSCVRRVLKLQPWGSTSSSTVGFIKMFAKFFVQIVKCICLNSKMYLSKFKNIFVKIQKYICINGKRVLKLQLWGH